MDRIENVILDLGGVIINLDYQLTVHALKNLVPNLDPASFCGTPNQLSFYSEYERGEITTAQMLEAFNRHQGSNLTLNEFVPAWNAMILDLPAARLERIRALSKGVRLFLYSNINALHEERLYKIYSELSSDPFHELFEKVYLSHLFRMRKPDPEGFRQIVIKNDLDPKKTLFIDDSEQHIQGAQSVGMMTQHLQKPKTLDQLLEELNLI